MQKFKKCPSCGHPLPDDSVPPVGMTPAETRIFKVVLAHSPLGIFSQNELRSLVYADRPDGGPLEASVIRTQISRLNIKLKAVGLKIQGRRGYRLIELTQPPKRYLSASPKAKSDVRATP